MNPHDQPPHTQSGQPPEEVRAELDARVEAIRTSAYYQNVRIIEPYVVGRRVVKTEAGSSGFLLYLDNSAWVLSHLEENEFRWKMGTNAPGEPFKLLMNSPDFGDASMPLNQNRPNAHLPCNFSEEVAHAVGQVITGLGYGQRCFSFCFPDGRVLDVTLREDNEGKQAYRVFWEQW